RAARQAGAPAPRRSADGIRALMRRLIRAVAWLAAIAVATCMAAGCATAPIAQYRGSIPAPRAIRAFDPSASAPDPFLVPGTTNRAAHQLGTLSPPRVGDSVTVIVYGDNRP